MKTQLIGIYTIQYNTIQYNTICFLSEYKTYLYQINKYPNGDEEYLNKDKAYQDRYNKYPDKYKLEVYYTHTPPSRASGIRRGFDQLKLNFSTME